MLDKELQQIVRQAKRRRRYVDKLVKVWLKSGEEQWLLIHVEVQTEREGDFPRRMYVYNYRIFDRYDREVISLAILADDDPRLAAEPVRLRPLGLPRRHRVPGRQAAGLRAALAGAGGGPEPVRRGGAGPPEDAGDAAGRQPTGRPGRCGW